MYVVKKYHAFRMRRDNGIFVDAMGFVIFGTSPTNSYKSEADFQTESMIYLENTHSDSDLLTETLCDKIFKNPDKWWAARSRTKIPSIVVDEFDIIEYFLNHSLNDDCLVQYSYTNDLGTHPNTQAGDCVISFTDNVDATMFKLQLG